MGYRELFALVLLTGCAAGVSSDPSGEAPPPSQNKPPPKSGTPADDAGASPETPDANAGISGGGTGFTSTKQMYDYINMLRQQYSNHIPYDGYPFQGANAQAMTWTTTLVWDASLAAKAQTEADRLANGDKPSGQYFPFMNDANGEGFTTYGLDTPEYVIASRADGALPPFTNAYGIMEPAHHFCFSSNGFFRMAVAYQTGSGAYNKKTRLGVGAAEGGTNVTWWVLIFG